MFKVVSWTEESNPLVLQNYYSNVDVPDDSVALSAEEYLSPYTKNQS